MNNQNYPPNNNPNNQNYPYGNNYPDNSGYPPNAQNSQGYNNFPNDVFKNQGGYPQQFGQYGYQGGYRKTEFSVPPVSGNAPAAKKTYNWVGMSLFIFAMVVIVLQVIGSSVISALGDSMSDNAKELLESMSQWLLTIIPMYCIGLPVLYLLLQKSEVFVRNKEKLGAGRFFKILLICFAVMFVGNIVGSALMNIMSGGTAENPLNEAIAGELPMRILVMVILAPIIEEFIFRKLIIDRTDRYSEKAAIIFSALCFGIYHMNLYQFFYAFALGIIFGYVYVRTRDIKYTIFMHMIINFMGSVIAPAVGSLVDTEAVSKYSETQSQQLLEQFLPGYLVYLAYIVFYFGLVIAGLILLVKNAKKVHFNIGANQISKQETFKTVYLNVGVILFLVFCTAMTILVAANS